MPSEAESVAHIDMPRSSMSNIRHRYSRKIRSPLRVSGGQNGNAIAPAHREPSSKRKIASPSPLGLCAFALTEFLSSCLSMSLLDVNTPAILISSALAYGGLVQLLAGMWEMVVGNTFNATALGSFGGYWISTAIIFTPGGFEIIETYKDSEEYQHAYALFYFGWFIFTTLLIFCSLSSNFAVICLYVTLDISTLLLALGHRYPHLANGTYEPHGNLIYAGGVFGILSAFAAWYMAFADIIEHDPNSLFKIPVGTFPWSEAGQAQMAKRKKTTTKDNV